MASPPPCSLSPSARKEVEDRCDAIIERTITQYQSFRNNAHHSSWAHMRTRKGMELYHERQTGVMEGDPGKRAIAIHGVLPGNTDDVIMCWYADTTEAFVHGKKIQSKSFIDGAILEVLESHSPEHDVIFAGVKWACFQTTIGPLVNDHDSVYYERQGRYTDHDGTPYVFVAILSVDIPGYSSSQSEKIIRAETTMCYLFKDIDGHYVHSFVFGYAHDYGLFIGQIADLILADRTLEHCNTLTCAQAKAFSTLMARNLNVPASSSSHCEVCTKHPSFFFKLHLCRGCKRRVCGRCSKKRVVFRLDVRSRKPLKQEFCVNCVEAVENRQVRCPQTMRPAANIDDQSALADNQTPYSSSSQSSELFSEKMSGSWRATREAATGAYSPVSSLSMQDEGRYSPSQATRYNASEWGGMDSFVETQEEMRQSTSSSDEPTMTMGVSAVDIEQLD